MAIVLPRFEEGSLCQMMGVCSHLTVAASTAALPTEDLDIVSGYGAHMKRAFARLVWNPKVRHFHVDVALSTAFVKPPKTNTKLAAFRKMLARFEGLAADAQAHGYFDIPRGSLPMAGGIVFAGTSSVRLSIGKDEIELTGATLTFRQSEIHRMRWNLVKDMVLLDVDAKRRSLIIGEGFLTDALGVFDSAVATYVLGKRADERAGE